jgi:hypothetical protein
MFRSAEYRNELPAQINQLAVERTSLVHPHLSSAINEGSSTFSWHPRLTASPPERTFVRNIYRVMRI